MRNRSERGVTLIESMIALAVLTTGLAALFGMINHVQSANRSMAFQTAALDAFARVSAQVRDAQCDFPADVVPAVIDPLTTDPGLNTVLFPARVTAAIGGSSISFVGDATTNPADFADYVPPIRVDYRVRPEPLPAPTAPVSMQVDVRVREVTGDAARDDVNLDDGYWIRVFPVQKICNPRLDATRRGEYR